MKPSTCLAILIACVAMPAFERWAVAAAASEKPTKPGRPSILLIMPDQMRASAMGCDGNRDVQTPHIDRLAAEGIRFRKTYSNTPVCCPARAVLLTGTYAHRNGMVANDLRLREDQVTLAEVLREAGYRTGFVGKWHLDGGPRTPGFVPPGPRRQGFEFWAGYQCHHQHFLPYYFRDTEERIVVKKFEPEASCDYAVEFLRGQPREQPFFLAVWMGPPHDPYGAPAEYMRRYDPQRLTMPPSWKAGSEVRPARKTPEGEYVATGGREELAAYYAAITAIDDQVGRLLAVLKEIGRDECFIEVWIGRQIAEFARQHSDCAPAVFARAARRCFHRPLIAAVHHDPAALREEFRAYPLRRELQERFAALIPPPQRPEDAQEVASWFFCDAWGNSVARVPEGRTLGMNFAWRSYFHGGPRDMPDDWRPAPSEFVPRTKLSAVFRSRATYCWMVAVSAPVFDDSPERRFLGVVAMTAEVGRFIDFAGTKDQFAVLVDRREGDRPGVVLQHPLFDALLDKQGSLPDRFQTYRVRDDDLPDTQHPQLQEHYSDPLAADPEGGAFKRHWLARMEPVVVRGEPTGWVVIVQEAYDAAIGSTLEQLKRGLKRYGIAALSFVALVMAGLWGLASQLDGARHARARTKRDPGQGDTS